MPLFRSLVSLNTKFVNRYAGHPLRLLSFSIKSILLYHIFTTHIYNIEPTHGASMLPTLEVVGDWVLISKSYRRGRGVKVGDVIAFNSVVDPDERVIKRVLGMEGDLVLRDTPESGSDSMIQVRFGLGA